MIEQKKSIKEGQGIVVATEAKDGEKEANDKKAKQKQQLHHAIVFSLFECTVWLRSTVHSNKYYLDCFYFGISLQRMFCNKFLLHTHLYSPFV